MNLNLENSVWAKDFWVSWIFSRPLYEKIDVSKDNCINVHLLFYPNNIKRSRMRADGTHEAQTYLLSPPSIRQGCLTLWEAAFLIHAHVTMSWHKTEYVHLPHNGTSRFLEVVKGDLGPETSDVYNIPSECGWVCTGQTADLLKPGRERAPQAYPPWITW
jgi:hypothetical protein